MQTTTRIQRRTSVSSVNLDDLVKEGPLGHNRWGIALQGSWDQIRPSCDFNYEGLSLQSWCWAWDCEAVKAASNPSQRINLARESQATSNFSCSSTQKIQTTIQRFHSSPALEDLRKVKLIEIVDAVLCWYRVHEDSIIPQGEMSRQKWGWVW